MPPNKVQNVFDYITSEEANYKTAKIPITDGWEWNMFEHVRKTTLYKNSKFAKGQNDGLRPFKNINRPILNVAYRSEGFDVKDIEPFVDDADLYYMSFLVRKFHAKWARANNIDTFIDETVESYVDFGLALVKNVNEVRPELVPLARLAFCDQTDILSGPLCEKHNYSPDQMSEMDGKWYPEAVEMSITQSKTEKKAALTGADGKTAKTPGKYIEVYELHGTFPETWLNTENGDKKEGDEGYVEPLYGDSTKYSKQIHIVTYYVNQENKRTGICLFKGPERKEIYKALVRDRIFGRACGLGGLEEIFEDQTWVNYSELKIKEMLDAAALVILQTADKNFETNNGNIKNLETGRILYNSDNQNKIEQISLTPQNIEKFNAAVAQWESHARTTGSANDPLLGMSPDSGTPFKLQDLVVQEGQGIHEYRRGKISTFISEIYRDWILPHLVDEMNNGQKFLDELSLDELQYVAECVATNYANDKIKKTMLPEKASEAKVMGQAEIDSLRDLIKEQFMKGGKKRFLEILQDELKDLPHDVFVNIAGKQKDLAKNADKLTNIFRQILINPAVLQEPGMGKLFNEILENSGFSAVDFTSFTKQPQQDEVKSVTSSIPSSQSIATPVSA